ncbi:MAG TPA: hypothetical protein VFK40_09140 [Nitrososphaeraceae archaeon]|nr:hypothetical protein [Nitrososphaeraceae archaeon]
MLTESYINIILNLKLQNVFNPLMIFIGFVILLSQSIILCDAHIKESKIQEWVDKSKNIKIQFAYSPEKPIIDTFTQLTFSVQDLETGEHIKDFDARAVVTNGQRLFKFENITVADGDFSVKYLFPDDGTHQVLTRINTNNSILLASFSVFVPHQSPPSLINPFPSAPSQQNENEHLFNIIITIIILIAVSTLTIIMIKKAAVR